jgi:CRISPR/Cas system CMR-associated protein Cmr3 (group 5 of RAMP superfamily)
MAITINGFKFYDEPSSCGTCAFFNNGQTEMSAGSERGVCIAFDETHHRWKQCPRRCKRIFRKAFTQFSDGAELTIVINDNNNEDENI